MRQLSFKGTRATGMDAASAARTMQRADSPMPRSAVRKPTTFMPVRMCARANAEEKGDSRFPKS